jgi:L-threonylcarbamoyladenylate synthase
MRTLAVDPQDPDSRAVDEAVRVLRAGGVVAFPTETFYGLAVDARSLRACERLLALKGRPEDKAFPCVVSGVPQLEEVASRLEAAALVLAKAFWPGPLTLVVEAKPGYAAAAPDGSIAVRSSGLRLAREIPRSFGAPVTSTSANRSGSPATRTAAEAIESFEEGVDLVLDGGPCPGGLPSTIVDVRQSNPRLVREGRISFDDVLRALTWGPGKLE